MPDLPVAGVALVAGIDRLMSEARALTSTMSNAVACIVASIWEKARDREVPTRELAQNYADTELALEEDATIPTAAPAATDRPALRRPHDSPIDAKRGEQDGLTPWRQAPRRRS